MLYWTEIACKVGAIVRTNLGLLSRPRVVWGGKRAATQKHLIDKQRQEDSPGIFKMVCKAEYFCGWSSFSVLFVWQNQPTLALRTCRTVS